MSEADIGGIIRVGIWIVAAISIIVFRKRIALRLEQFLTFAGRHKWVLGFFFLIVFLAVIFRYETFNTPRGVYILDRWTGRVELGAFHTPR